MKKKSKRRRNPYNGYAAAAAAGPRVKDAPGPSIGLIALLMGAAVVVALTSPRPATQ